MQKRETGWLLNVALVLVMDSAKLKKRDVDTGNGTGIIVEGIRNDGEVESRMRIHPEYCTFVLLPTICNNEHNMLVVLGPGGVEILKQNKGTPFVLKENNGVLKKEQLEYTNQVHILITKELGNIAFPICAEFLDPVYYPVLENAAHVDTILCPSFSPGIGAFRNYPTSGCTSGA